MTPSASDPLPYRDLRVLDISQGVAGPYCGMLLAQYGADVLKVEPPEGDWARNLGTRYGEHTALDVVVNRGKRSVVLDLRQDAGRATLTGLARRCDVFIESFRPGVAARLGVGWEAVHAANPRAMYVSVSGFGQAGPYAQRPGSDSVIQAFSGLMAINRDSTGKPNRVGFLVVDTVTGLYAFQALAAALYEWRATRAGRHLDVSLMQSMAAFLAPKILEAAREGGTPRLINAPAGSYRTKDGWITVTLVKEENFASICKVLGRDDLPADPRFCSFVQRSDHLAELVPLLQERLLERETADWVERFAAENVLCNAVYDFADWCADPQVVATGGAPQVDVPDMGRVPIPAIPGVSAPAAGDARNTFPAIGEQGASALRAWGAGEAEIVALAGTRAPTAR